MASRQHFRANAGRNHANCILSARTATSRIADSDRASDSLLQARGARAGRRMRTSNLTPTSIRVLLSDAGLTAKRTTRRRRDPWRRAIVALGYLWGAFFLGLMVGWSDARRSSLLDLERMAESLAGQRELLGAVQRVTATQIGALASEVGRMRARLSRLDALGTRLVDIAGLGQGEFEFSPATAAPAACDHPNGGTTANALPSLHAVLNSMDDMIEDRSRQLDALDLLIRSRALAQYARPTLRPVAGARVSSQFGRRADPFSGESRFHEGIDFTGQLGTPVLAAATGVVSHAGRSESYGLVVELKHPDGYLTRYAHNASVFVLPGQTILRGEPIALIGSNGRSTGPHLHFEVFHGGDSVNPLSVLDSDPAF
jgi:murein DD-endopeptidase MepM/ murein hydrolase activator NlpD